MNKTFCRETMTVFFYIEPWPSGVIYISVLYLFYSTDRVGTVFNVYIQNNTGIIIFSFVALMYIAK